MARRGEQLSEAARESTSTLMACSWAPDSSRLATAGSDGVVVLWDAGSSKEAQRFEVGGNVEDQQNGACWVSENVIASVSLSGVINLFDPREGNKWRKLYGPTKAITASTIASAREGTFYTGSFDGGVKAFTTSGENEGMCSAIDGTGHSARVVGMTADGEGKIWSAGWDDKVTSIDGHAFM